MIESQVLDIKTKLLVGTIKFHTPFFSAAYFEICIEKDSYKFAHLHLAKEWAKEHGYIVT